VLRGLLDQKETQALAVKVRLARPDLEHREHKVIKGHRVFKGEQDLLAHKGLRVIPALKV